jgi:putative endopeptidase
MSSIARRVAVFVISLALAQIAAELAGSAAAGGWGFDLAGADFAKNPGDGNGAWYDRALIPRDRSSIGVDTALIISAEARIRDILERGEQGVAPSVRADAAKIGAFYAAFMDEARAEKLDVEPIAPLLGMIRAAETREQLADLMGGGRQFSSVFGVSIAPDDKAPDRYAVFVRQGGLGLNRDYYVTPRLAEKKAAYRSYIAQMLDMIGWEAPQQSAAAILDFETAIAQVSWTNAERRDPDKTYNPTTVVALDEAAPFPWRRLFTSADLGALDHVVVVENTAIPKIAAIYARTPVAVLKAWHAFHLVDNAAPYLSQRFIAANFGFHSRTMAGVAEQPERWKRAVGSINFAMGQAIGRVYVARYFPSEARAQIEDLVAHLRIALKERIARLDWMSPQTKLKALDKLARLNGKLAYPDKWRDYSALEVRPDDLFADMQAARKFFWQRQALECAGRSRGMGVHEPADRERQLRCDPQRDDLSGRHTPAAFLRSRSRSGRQLRRHWCGNRPRNDPRL